MNLFINLVFLITGWLSYNQTLDTVAINRKTIPVEYKIDVDTTKYECLIGLPYGNKHLIGKDVYFYDYDKMIMKGPWLVVDVESVTHSGIMKLRHLAADTNCKEYVSDYGVIMIWD